MTATILQEVSGASSAAAPASFTLSGITATTKGTLLILHVAAATSAAASISTPVGWTALNVATVNGTALRGQSFFLANNAGGIASVALATLTNVNGIACAFYEVAGMTLTAPSDTQQANSNTSANVSSGGVIITLGGEFWCGYEADVTGQAFTVANTLAPLGATWSAGATATSTLGATNVVIRPFSTVGPPIISSGAAVALTGTLAGSLAYIAGMYSFTSTVSAFLPSGTGGPGQEILVSGGQGYGVGSQ